MNFTNIAIPANNRSQVLPTKRSAPRDGQPPIQFEKFTDPSHISILMAALLKIEERLLRNESVLRKCNAWFEIMSKNRGDYKMTISFSRAWNNSEMLICLLPEPPVYVSSYISGNLIGLAGKVFTHANPVVWTAGTLIHELAHWAGASAQTKDAEASLEFCGFDDVRTPGLVG